MTTRPFLDYFLQEVSKHFEITVFTAARADYADVILDEIDKSKYITHRLYRHHLTKFNGVSIKDLSLIGRDLTRTIIVDNISENFIKQPENGIKIDSFFGEEEDHKLLILVKELIKMVTSTPKDIRPYLPKIRDRLNKQIRPKMNNIVINYMSTNCNLKM